MFCKFGEFRNNNLWRILFNSTFYCLKKTLYGMELSFSRRFSFTGHVNAPNKDTRRRIFHLNGCYFNEYNWYWFTKNIIHSCRKLSSQIAGHSKHFIIVIFGSNFIIFSIWKIIKKANANYDFAFLPSKHFSIYFMARFQNCSLLFYISICSVISIFYFHLIEHYFVFKNKLKNVWRAKSEVSNWYEI